MREACRYVSRVEPQGFAGETGARPGIMTSEFLLTLLAATTLVIAGYV